MHVSCLLCTYWFRWKISRTTTMKFRETKNEQRAHTHTLTWRNLQFMFDEENYTQNDANDDDRTSDRSIEKTICVRNWMKINTHLSWPIILVFDFVSRCCIAASCFGQMSSKPIWEFVVRKWRWAPTNNKINEEPKKKETFNATTMIKSRASEKPGTALHSSIDVLFRVLFRFTIMLF